MSGTRPTPVRSSGRPIACLGAVLGYSGREPEERNGPRAGLLLLALPVLCCGGPAIVAGLAAASAVTLGVVGGVLGTVLAAVALGWWMHRRRASSCCGTASEGWRP
jgi:hypothetical protein